MEERIIKREKICLALLLAVLAIAIVGPSIIH